MTSRFARLVRPAFLMIFLSSCSQPVLPTAVPPVATTAVAGEKVTVNQATPAPSETQSLVVATPTMAPTATPAPWRVAAAPAAPAEAVAAAQEIVTTYPHQFVWVDEGESDILLQVGDAEDAHVLGTWVYAVAVPFTTVSDGVTLAELQSAWRGEGGVPPLLAADTAALLQGLWGEGQAEIVAESDLTNALWARRTVWTLIPFHHLTPELKVWAVDGISPVAVDFEFATYPFAIKFSLGGKPGAVEAFAAYWPAPLENLVAEKITRVAMTGVTALVRATAYQMEIRSITYPGEEVMPLLQAVDIAHISNEVSFVPECPPPHYIGGTTFCTSPRYMELLQFLGVDVVEMTGNHVNDWGAGYIPYTLQLYENAGMQYFGGGRDLVDAQEPAIFEHNGNTIVFLGCNPAGPAGAWAGAEWGGARPCDELFGEQIRTYRDSGAFVIATQQYWESYHYAPTAQQREDFAAIAAAGAAAVSGSQAHHVQGFGFDHGAFIHYGLGNLFFDQMDQPGTRQTFVDVYTIYENRLLNVSLWTGLIENYARPRLMTPEERADLLETTFQASGW
ncbi:MAG: CapA family protein [Anaerolineae bacterium]|nr:CapA family protein [Anaerolineae bacterium]